ncbi:hypothetical protein [Curtobacterium sp. 24E2]|nr:hypothetical protein JN350_15010 [Curtobacterium sp. 24E2]
MSTDDTTEGKGDLFVALGLARALLAEGWGSTSGRSTGGPRTSPRTRRCS